MTLIPVYTSMQDILRWLTGGEHQYMTTWHCMNQDAPWVLTIGVLCFTIIIGYLIIAFHWYSNLRTLKKGLAKSSLFNMVNIFLFCGICGYLFPLIKMGWPIWRLHAIFLLVLNIFTWRYALNTPKLRVVYEELHNTGKITEQLHEQKKITGRVMFHANKTAVPMDALAKEVISSIDSTDDPETKEKLERIKTYLGSLENTVNDIRKAIEPK